MIVAVLHRALDHVADGLKPAMGMLRKSGEITRRVVGADHIQHQKRIDMRKLRRADHTGQLYARAVFGRHTRQLACDRAGGGFGFQIGRHVAPVKRCFEHRIWSSNTVL